MSIHKYRYIDIAVEQYLSNLPVPLIEVHLSDNHGENDQHLPLGKGNMDFTAIASGLKCIRFNEITTIEIEQEHQPNTLDTKRQVTESLLYWRQMELMQIVLLGKYCLRILLSAFFDPINDCTEIERVDAIENEGHPRPKQHSDNNKKESRHRV